MLLGQLLMGPNSDLYSAGYAFRDFAATYWRSHHAIPPWDPYLFGGIPFVGGMHGDIFYPAAWLRWILPTGVALSLSFALHLVLAGAGCYGLLRGLRVRWGGAVVGGLAYELTGIVASQASPGHDGKLYVSALAPLLFLALLRGIRDRRLTGYAAIALIIGLSLHAHPIMTYYLLIAGGLWGLFLVFGKPEGAAPGPWFGAVLPALAAVAVGFGLYAIQAVPFVEYIPFSPRAAGGPSGGWEYATAYAFPPAELFTTFLPQLNGIKEAYAGSNYFKLHTEYVGALTLLLATLGLSGSRMRRERWALIGIGILFLLVSFGGHTPFYRVWYELMPMIKKVRAPGMAFYLVALPVAVLAGFGAERVFSREVAAKPIAIGAGIFALLGLLGAMGGLDGIAQALASPELVQRALQHAPDLHKGALRLLLVSAAGGAVLILAVQSRLRAGGAVLAVLVVILGDLWSIDRDFFVYSGTATELFGDDAITTTMKKAPLPFRVWDPKGRYERDLGVYPGSWLMGVGVPQLFGYHGQELNNFDALFGGKGDWPNQVNLGLLRLFAVRYAVLAQPQELPGFHKVLDSVRTTPGVPATLYEADTTPPYVRLLAGAVKVPEAGIVGVVADPRFPVLEVGVYPDSAPITPADLGGRVPQAAAARATIRSWEPGRMTVAIDGEDPRPLYLVVAENWYKDWQATVDGRAVPVLRAQGTLLSVVVPSGARAVAFEFRSRSYEKGRLISLVSLLILIGAVGTSWIGGRRAAQHG